MSSTSRSNQQPWSTAFEIAPPAACNTLRNNHNAVEWGYTCVFAEEDGPAPPAINTACMAWVAAATPAPTAFYSPATACPTSWTPVATRTTASGADDQWIDGETALSCCPSGFVGDKTGACSPGTSGTWPIMQCGEADAEENELRTYTAGSWPATATAQVPALQLRFQATDTGGAPAATSSSASTNGNGTSGLSTGAKAALGTTIPLVFLLGALAFFLLWRRRRRNARSLASVAHAAEEEHLYPKPRLPLDTTTTAYAHPQLSTVPGTALPAHETPEWNVEMDAVEAERRRYVAVQGSVFRSVAEDTVAKREADEVGVAELGGLARVARKLVAPVEIDSEGGVGRGG
jgi:MYXO-CTERM domain-containing protein